MLRSAVAAVRRAGRRPAQELGSYSGHVAEDDGGGVGPVAVVEAAEQVGRVRCEGCERAARAAPRTGDVRE